MEQLLKRAQLDYGAVAALAPGPQPVEPRVAQQVEIEIKYEGYIQKQQKEIEKFKDFEQRPIPPGLAYDQIHGLSTELRQKLSAIRPTSLGQASRIDGMTPAALSVLMIAIKAAGARPETAAS
jgi:tRNA uridine 5-carboxymethylaminomethyl modification enzyme